MRFYILRRASEYVIYKVSEADEPLFREKYGTEILIEAGSLMQLLLDFEKEIMYSLEFIPDAIRIKRP